MTLQGQKCVWSYLSVMMINHFSFIFWLPIQWGSTYGSSVSVNLTFSTGMARPESQREQIPVKSKHVHMHSLIRQRVGIGSGSIWGGGDKEVMKRGKNCYCFIEVNLSLVLWSRKRFFFIISYPCFLGTPMPPDPLCPSQILCACIQEALKNTCRPCLIKNNIILFLLLGGFTLLS